MSRKLKILPQISMAGNIEKTRKKAKKQMVLQFMQKTTSKEDGRYRTWLHLGCTKFAKTPTKKELVFYKLSYKIHEIDT